MKSPLLRFPSPSEPDPGFALLREAAADGHDAWLLFREPLAAIEARRVDEIVPALREVEDAVAAGSWVAGFLCYEAAPAFDPAFAVYQQGAPTPPLPLLWFGVYHKPLRVDSLPPAAGATPALEWAPSVSREEYREAIARIKECIARGETYQVNYTLRLRAPFKGSAWELFTALHRAQRGRYSAYLDLGGHALCSASPELFFRLSGREISCRPMKGTAPRGLTGEEDEACAGWLRASVKNRAENVMIVDMMRNDLGRVARTGSVSVPDLFALERYETLFQMTSTVSAATDASLSELMRALFPCASITGAPKVRTMEIIAGLESAPRSIYTGCIGFAGPGRRAQFNVAIRTVHVDRSRALAEYGTGGGIVWDSVDTQEYEECRTKALILFADRPAFQLLETLRWRPDEGYFLLRRHLARLEGSARYFGYPVEIGQVEAQLAEAAGKLPPQPHRVRLLLAEEGVVSIEATPFTAAAPLRPWRVALAREPVDVNDRFLYHKTTHRTVYEAARAGHPHCDDVLLWNTRGEITEATIANVVVQLGEERVTPPVASGLLAGTFRAELLDAGEIREGVLTRDDLHRADALFLINSVRGWIPATLDA